MMADGAAMPASFVPDPANPRPLRDALGHFATGVTVVTIAGPDGPMGFTANSFSSLSLDPPLVLWSLARSSRHHGPFAAAAHFSIHILGQDQADWPRRFSSEGPGFQGLARDDTPEGTPVLPGVPMRFDCARHGAQDGGDHLIILGRVLRVTPGSGAPLVFLKGRFGGFATG
ncbi:MAG: flavin reductase family protein [Rhodobacterales bacterium]|nr:flavin reductase family protein [Rhodobacterales bacterium]